MLESLGKTYLEMLYETGEAGAGTGAGAGAGTGADARARAGAGATARAGVGGRIEAKDFMPGGTI